MMKTVRFLAGIVLLAGAILFLLGGGWHRLGLDRLRLRAPKISLPEPNQQTELEARLSAAVQPMGVKVMHFQLDGQTAHVVLSWPMTSGGTRGMDAMNAALQRRVVRAFQTEGLNYMDQRNENNVEVYIARFVVQF